MIKNPEEYLKKPYSRILIPEENGRYSAEILEFPGCFADGETANEAIENIEKAALAWLESSLERGLEIPEPASHHGYIGKIALRLPKSLHRKAAQLAERDGISLNQFIVNAITAKVGAEDLYERVAQKLESYMFEKVSATHPVMITGEPSFREHYFTMVSPYGGQYKIIDLINAGGQK